MPTIITVTGHEALASALKNNPRVTYLVFYADPDGSSVSWCPDCRYAEPVLQKHFPSNSVIVYCYVGNPRAWKDRGNVFRTDLTYALTRVPTVIHVRTGQRLVEGQCAKEDVVKAFFASENVE